MCMSNIETFCNNWWRFYLGSVHDASILCHAIEDGLPGNRNRLIKIFWHNSASGSAMGLKYKYKDTWNQMKKLLVKYKYKDT